MPKKKHAANHKRKNKKPYSREKMMSCLLAVDNQLKEYEQTKFLNSEKKETNFLNSEKKEPVNNVKQIISKPVQLSHTSDQEVLDLEQMLGTM